MMKSFINGGQIIMVGFFLATASSLWGAESPAKVGGPSVDVKSLGAVGDGVADDTAAIQKALDRPGPHRVVIPAGTYRISDTLVIGGKTHLSVSPEATIMLADGSVKDERSFMIRNRHMGNGDVDIIIEGGLWDYNNAGNARGQEGDPHGCTGAAMNFVQVQNLHLRNLVIKNPDAFSVRLCAVTDFLVEDIGFDQTVRRKNQDGIHVGGFCERGVIRRIKALTSPATNDDMIALNADDDVERVINIGMRRGPIRDILVEEIEATDAYTFVRLLSTTQPIERIRIRKVTGGCSAHGLNLTRWVYPKGAGVIREVEIEDWNIWRNRRGALCDLMLNVESITFHNFNTPADKAAPDAQTLVIENDAPWTVSFEGLTGKQIESLLAASTNLKVLRQQEQNGILQLEVEGAEGTKLILPAGNIPFMRLQSEKYKKEM
jgi:hypothetical protein